MCVVSMVGDHYADKWEPFKKVPNFPTFLEQQVTRAEFEQIKRDVEELKLLLIRAKKYDEETGQPDCEIDEKMDLLRKVADAVGIDLDEVIGKAV